LTPVLGPKHGSKGRPVRDVEVRDDISIWMVEVICVEIEFRAPHAM